MGGVSAPPGRWEKESMESDSTPGSLSEPPLRQGVRDLAEQRLARRVAPPQGVEPEATCVEIDLGADQPVRPRGVYLETVPQHLDGPFRAGPAQVDQASTRLCLKVR